MGDDKSRDAVGINSDASAPCVAPPEFRPVIEKPIPLAAKDGVDSGGGSNPRVTRRSFFVVGHARGEVAVALASNDCMIQGRGDEYGLHKYE
jgi:hypothetical protein